MRPHWWPVRINPNLQAAAGPPGRSLQVALVGTRGVPARYGGFETAVEEVGRRLVGAGIGVRVYCRRDPSSPSTAQPSTYLGISLIYLPALRLRVAETLSHTALSLLHLVVCPVDAVVVFNAANATLVPLLKLRRIPFAIHVDGLEWQRAKWGRYGRRYYRLVEGLAVRWSDALIADARGIAEYYRQEFDARCVVIAYGAPIIEPSPAERLAELGLSAFEYHLVVARFEPENHVDVIVAGYAASAARHPLVVVGSAPYSDAHTAAIRAVANGQVRFLGGVWDQALLDELYANALTYLHGHSVGGTNPSLLRAMGAGAPVVAFDVVFNREVAGDAALYFADAQQVRLAVERAERDPGGTRLRGAAGQVLAREYDWDDVAKQYAQLVQGLAAGCDDLRPRGRRRRRRRPDAARD